MLKIRYRRAASDRAGGLFHYLAEIMPLIESRVRALPAERRRAFETVKDAAGFHRAVARDDRG